MQKIQILFPDPQMKKLREMAKREDRPISEIVRRATEAWMERAGSEYDPSYVVEAPVFHVGEIKIRSEAMREAAYSREGR